MEGQSVKWIIDELELEIGALFVARPDRICVNSKRKTEILSSRPSEIPEHIYEKGDRVAII